MVHKPQFPPSHLPQSQANTTSSLHQQQQPQIESSMATLQKFKLFATQCAAVNIPTQSPTTSPLLLRRPRRKTLRMLLTRRPHISDPDHRKHSLSPPSAHKRLKLKDLFFSSSSSPTSHAHLDNDCEIGPVRTCRETGPRSVRPVFQPFGYRNRLLLRKAWRPVLSTIEEIQD